ncbi:hypothetical protein [uncultured Rikenella sp.]|uniref:hypothetical protein n=1 Tax=uncultured Rikenella sp. TaxID=368003 RepID=UPI00260F4885|nr:hypothetical protein [uncultured Rikenella sp.]
MDHTIIYSHVFTPEQFQRVLHYTKKYYGMDEPYFYRTLDAWVDSDQPITIYNRLPFEDFYNRLLFADKSTTRYMELIPNEEIAIIWALMFIEWGLQCERLKEQDDDYTLDDYYTDNPNEYYRDHMREELLKTYLFCKQTPVRPGRTNEIILTINKGIKGYHEKLTLPNFENWILRGALLQYCENHLEDIHSVEEARQALDGYHAKGRKANETVDRIIYGTYAMFKETAKDVRMTSTGLCRIIQNYLVYLRLVESDQETALDPQNIAGRIKYLLRAEKQPRFSPYIVTDLDILRQSGRNTFQDMID